ncbi:MAG TPA: CDP-alcohol phosphatidyltransferase family protein [Gemmatimonadaceae bacterium]|nr:CDP-alcohol phosphatidyltransferase family protein [Gemmatimonadaceae bacterium]
MSPVETAALALVLAILATMPAFALKSRHRTTDAEVAKRPATVLLGFWVRDWFMWLLGPVERPLVRARVSPDLLNYLGVGFGVAAAAAFVANRLPVAGWMITLSGVCDILDGRLARALGKVTDHGAFLDSTLDRFAEAATFVGVAWVLAGRPWTVCATMLAMGGSLLVSYARARGEALGVDCKGGVMQRAERLVFLAVACFADGAVTDGMGWQRGTLLAGSVSLIGVGSVGTAIYRTAKIASTLKHRDRGRL